MRSALLSALKGLHRERIFGPAASAFLLRVVGAGLQFLFTVVLARLYGASGVGLFVIALSMLVVSSTIARWGLDQTTMKLVAANLEGNQYATIRSILRYARNFILLSGAASTIIMLLFSDWLAGVFFKHGDATAVIAVMSLAILPLSLATLYAEALRGFRKITVYTLLHGTLIPALSTFFVLMLSKLFDGVIAGAIAYLVATTLAMVLAVILCARYISRSPDDSRVKEIDRRGILATANALSWVTIISVIMSFMETFILGLFHDDASVGRYAAALRLALIVNFIIIAFNSILAPNFSSLFRQAKLPEIERQARHSILIMLVFTLPAVAIFCLLPSQILSIFGKEFEQASTALVLLSVGQLINVFSGPVGILLQMTGHESSFRNNVILSSGTTLVSALILIPPYEVVGAAISAVIGILLLNALSLLSVRKRLGINPLPLNPASLFSRINS